MKFEIDFNRETDDKTLELLGAKSFPTGSTKYPPFDQYIIELTTLEELQALLKKVEEYKGGVYSAIVSLDPLSIYLDKDL